MPDGRKATSRNPIENAAAFGSIRAEKLSLSPTPETSVSIQSKPDLINSPSHYSAGRRFEVIDVLEDWCARCPDPVQAALLFNCLKYLGRLYDKNKTPVTDAKKARWYLERLIKRIESDSIPFEAFPADFYEQLAEAGWEFSDTTVSDDGIH